MFALVAVSRKGMKYKFLENMMEHTFFFNFQISHVMYRKHLIVLGMREVSKCMK